MLDTRDRKVFRETVHQKNITEQNNVVCQGDRLKYSKKKCICIVGKSGTGKSTLVNRLKFKYNYTSVESYTTRPPRSDEETGHIFITQEEFDTLPNKVAINTFGEYDYCATKEQIDNADLSSENVRPGTLVPRI